MNAAAALALTQERLAKPHIDLALEPVYEAIAWNARHAYRTAIVAVYDTHLSPILERLRTEGYTVHESYRDWPCGSVNLDISW